MHESEEKSEGGDKTEADSAAPAGRELGDIDGLLTQHLPELRAFVRLRSGPRIRQLESCSDLVQSVCREVLEGSEERAFPTDAAFRMWLMRVAEHKIIDRLRFHSRAKRDVERTVMDGAIEELAEPYARLHDPVDAADLRDQVARVEAAFDELPEDYREVISLAHILGLSHAQIAVEMGRSVDSVRNLLFRALARLGRILGEQGSDG